MFLNRIRPKSQSVSSSSKKPTFQIRYKSKGKMLTEGSGQDFARFESQYSYNKKCREEVDRQNEFFIRTAEQLESNNFSHHNEENCVCKNCECGRHLCKLNVIKPGFTKKTIYKRSFYKQRPIKNVVNHDKEYEKLKGPHLDLSSTYTQGFKDRRGDALDRPHPEDLLKSRGPCQQITSYANQFPGHRMDNQYIKPTNKHSIGYFPLRSKTTYGKQYVQRQQKKDDYTYISDQLKTGSNWYGRTTYSDFYNQPDPQYHAKKVKIVEKLDRNPDDNQQFKTTYQRQFKEKKNPMCPAKVYLQTKGHGIFNNSKAKFAENSDFKSFSPEYHAISNSKHFYV